MALYFASRDFMMFKKYGNIITHHVYIRFIVRPSHGALTGLPLVIASIVSAQCRLYGTMRSGNSWCIRLHGGHRRRLMYIMILLPSLHVSFRERQLRGSNNSPHIGHVRGSLLSTKRKTAPFDKAVVVYYYHSARSLFWSILHHIDARNFGTSFSAILRQLTSAVSGHPTAAETRWRRKHPLLIK